MEIQKKPEWVEWSDKAFAELAKAGILWQEKHPIDVGPFYSVPKKKSKLVIVGQLCQLPETQGGVGILCDDVSVCFIYSPKVIGSYVEVLAATIKMVARVQAGNWDLCHLKEKRIIKKIVAELSRSNEVDSDRAQRK